jgi:hypothetical protein
MDNAGQPQAAQSGSALIFVLLTVFSFAWGVDVTVPWVVFPEESLLSITQHE